MIAVEHMDYGALKLVRGEIDVNLLKVADSLSEFRKDSGNTSHIKSCVILLHQVQGALQVLDFTWASVLAGVTEKVARVLDEDHSKRTDWVYDTLIRSINELPHYLAKLQEGEITPPMGFIPLLNDLRVASGRSVLSEAMVFSHENPRPIISPLDAEIKNTDTLDVRALAGRLRPVYQTGLLVWYRDANNKAALRRLMEVMIQLQQASPDEGLWFAAGEVVGKLLEGELTHNTSIKLLLGQVERQIRRVMDAGSAELFSNPPIDLIKNLLHYVTVSEGDTQNSSSSASSQHDLSQEHMGEGVKSTLLDMATKAVKNELIWAHKKLDDFARSGGRHTPDELRSIMDVLRRVSGTLDMLGRWELRQRVRKQTGILDAMLGSENISNDPRILEVANALLYVESLLVDKKIPAKPALKEPPKDSLLHVQPMREEEFHELCRVIIHEVMVDLTQVKDDIIAFSKETGQCEILGPVPALMHRIIGALTMLSLRRPTIVLKAIYHYINHELLGVRIVPTQGALDTLADVLTSVEYFLETMVESQMNLDSLLDMAEGNITTLGYLVDRIDDIEVDVDVPEIAPDEEATIIQDETIELSSVQGDPFFGEEVVMVDVATGTVSSPQFMYPDSAAVIAADIKKDTAVMNGQNEEVVEEIIEIFIEEATEAIGTIQQYYPKWKKDNNDNEALKTFRRSFHTLKGSGRLVGANVVGELSWAVESLLNKIIEGEANVSSATFEYLEECLSVIPELVEKFKVNKTKVEISDDIQSLIKKSKVLVEAPEASLETGHFLPVVDMQTLAPTLAQDEPVVILPTPAPALLSADTSPAEIVDVLEMAVSEAPPLNAETSGVDPVLLQIFTNESAGRLKEIREFLEHCRRSRKSYITEPLMRNLHTLQGSAHMSGFMEIAELSDAFERHINFLNKSQTEVAENELAALNDFVGIVEIFLYLKQPLQDTPETAKALALQHELMLRINKIIEESHQYQAPPAEPAREEPVAEESVREEPVPEMAVSEHTDADKEHDEMVVQIFLEEAAEILENTEVALHQWISAPGVMAPMARLERELHTFKGGARMARIIPMGDLSHSVESLLSAVVAGDVAVTDEIIQLLQQSHDQLHHMLEQATKRVSISPAMELVSRLEALAGHAAHDEISASEPSAPQFNAINETFAEASAEATMDSIELQEPPMVVEAIAEQGLESLPDLVVDVSPETVPDPGWAAEKSSKEQIRIRADLLDSVVNQAGELSISRARLEQQVTMLRFGLNEMKQTVDRLREKIRKLDMETEAQILFRSQEVSNQGVEFDPLEFDRFSLVQQLSRGMMEGTSDLSSIQDQLEKQVGDAEALLLQQAHMNTELQETMMGTRLLPFSGVAARMKRLVRQISRDTGKPIDFGVDGEGVEMDRTVLDKIVAPLEHMIRNAIDHGIEDVQKRLALGKPEKGSISMRLAREGVEMVLRLQDDGAGFNLKAIRSKAIERGLIAERQVIDDQALTQFVLEAGFSTAEKVTQLSGRGVGMDVVNNEIKQLGGSLTIETRLNQGSNFTVRLPVALSVARALVVKEHGQIYAILNSSIDGVIRVEHEGLVKAYNEPAPVLEHASEHYPIHSLHGFLAGESSPLPDAQPRHLYLLVSGGGQRAALRIDAFVESREVVIKSLGFQLNSIRGIMGATIMGNGSVVLILDVPVLLRISLADAQSRLKNDALPRQLEGAHHAAHGAALTVMVVDDSITVRKVTARLLERHHMQVITAKDGIDALEVLQLHMPDVMLLDVEMPRMDGFELASVIRNDERLKHIPIIMITSRTGDKHREHALRIGVNKYLGKPYQEDELMENIRKLGKSDHADAELSLSA